MTRFFTLVFSTVLLVGPTPASALTVPDVYIESTTLDSAGPFVAGSNLSGTITIKNHGDSVVPSLPVSIDLMTDYVDGWPYELVDTYFLNPVRVNVGATVKVPFTITLPKAFSGEAGIIPNVEIVPGADRSGEPTKPFAITGGLPRVNVLSYGIELSNGLRVPPLSGPSIYKPGTGPISTSSTSATLVFNLIGESDASVKPLIKIYRERAGAGATLAWEDQGDSFVVKKGATTTAEFLLPDLGFEDSVLAGEARFVDSEGRDRTGIIHFRYISRSGDGSMGRIATYSFVGATPNSEEVSLIAAVTGAPIDFTITDKTANASAGVVLFEALSAKGKIVASTSIEVGLKASAQEIKLPLSLPKSEYLGFRLTLSSGGDILDKEEGVLFGVKPKTIWEDPVSVAIMVVSILMILLIVKVLMHRIKNRNSSPTIVTSLVVMLSILGALCAIPSSALAEDCDDDSPSVWFNRPVPGRVLQCGEQIPVSISGIYDACSNSGSNEKMWFEFEHKIFGETETAWDDTAITGKHERRTLTIPTVMLNAPVRNGTYYIDAYMQNSSGCWTKKAHARTSFTVTGCDLCLNISGDQSVVPVGMVRDGAGNCLCLSGSTFNPETGLCIPNGDDPNIDPNDPSTWCQTGYMFCNGACVSDSTDCTASATCPIANTGEQYCVELFDKFGNKTNQFSGFDFGTLEEVFGLGIREAYYARLAAEKLGLTTYPIFGVVGRSSSISAIANQGSAGCGGVTCAYEVNGCLTANSESAGISAECSAIGDVPGPSGLGPRANIDTAPPLVGKGGSCDVTWGSHEMSTCNIVGNGITSTTLAGKAKTPALNDSSTYVMTCRGQDGLEYKDSATCAVNPDVVEF